MKKHKLALLSLLLLALCVNCAAQEARPQRSERHRLMPVPMSVTFQPGRLAVSPSFRVAVKGFKDARLQGGIERAVRRLAERTGFELSRALGTDPAAASLVVECKGPGWLIPALNEDESYSLNVSAERATLSAPTVVGALRGLETFLQLLEGDRAGYFIPLAQIDDRPRFPWRGLLIDVCRHWEPMEVLKRNLDGMAAVKLNVLHWHLTEDQGFRVESKRFPKLHQMGSDGLYYTQDQVREVIAYARDRGIRVIPEFDIPGHSTSWLVGHPELGSAPGPYQIERKYGVFDPSLDPTREETYKFLDKFLGEMAALFPDAYMHIGGDEVTGKHWRLNPQIQAFMQKKGLKDKHALQAYFNQRVQQILQKHGKKMVGWDEILHPDLPNTIVIQSWRGQKALVEGAKKGYTGILSNGYYLDHLRPASYLYLVDPVRADSDMTAEEAARVLGGEACMWGEYVGPENIDSRIWPRMAAVAERFWSPRTVADVADMYRRLDYVSAQLEDLGLTHNTYSDKMLRRMAGRVDTGPLKTLTDLVEPLKGLGREKIIQITQQTPLTRIVDVAGPDSRPAREFALMADGLLADAPRFQVHREGIQGLLEEWRRVHPAIYVMADASPVMRDAEPLARDLSELSGAGLEALAYLSSGAAPPAEWRTEKLALIERVAATKREVEFPIIPTVRQLVTAAAELPQLNTMTPADWKTHVVGLANPKK
ncbi:MAG TPA: family 20 glycosylhydrolase [Pyrinomonadaceae bacterium]|nr:family 20 glycosylhydrolase [Pyrinomonadaceae bacterium]